MTAAHPLVVVVGATGTGKSDLSLDLAEAIAGNGGAAEIVNGDAMQCYRGMDIGTAKLPLVERRGIPHHLLDVLDVTEEASVAAFQEQARALIGGIRARGAVPILVGGSGLYVDAVVRDFRFPARDPAVRARYEARLEAEGVAGLHAELLAVDPEAATAIGPHNARRIVRALEVVAITGEPFGAGLPEEERAWTEAVTIGLALERERLVPRLDARVERMWAAGMVDEVAGLLRLGLERGVTASRAIGYAQAIEQLHGRMSEAEAVAATQALTRRYARRQVSWFRRSASTHWLPAEAPDIAMRASALVPAAR
ncbi:tRNA (adenosine(37)-N6)-dimethylallyltransferase MiaA [Arenivirga flava]|uniref:tRNA dimethylallyltransferase n=1 Tax=Arenivirga flava TaxID=1930060 RepID=A0AA37UCY0_9MICO|nr:tRNA (adenosine(37)-N6)-dimethylallyltransferase MiaA [Arenivirga flava]GMA27083.1 tRNA dimethylallyltransferase [Arenivirga flava]